MGPAPLRTTAVEADIPESEGHERRQRWLAVIGTIVAVLLVHGQNVGYRLFYDDYDWLADRPSNAGEVVGWFVPDGGAGIYRPLLHTWFQAMRAVFGVDPLAYHVVAILAMVGAALALRWFALELGLRNLPATTVGIIVGTHVALAPGTLWASAVQVPMMLLFVGCAMATVLRWQGVAAQVTAGAFLVVAVLWRDVAVMTPVIATVLIVAANASQPGVRLRTLAGQAVSTTAGLWVVGIAYGVLRIVGGAFGSGDESAPYKLSFGSHVLTNVRQTLKFAARFGIFRFEDNAIETLLARGWHYLFWATLIGLAIWALVRRSYLPMAGLLCFMIGTIPILGIANKPLATYYVDLGLIGLSVAVGSLLQTFRVRSAAVVVGLVALVIAQIVIMPAYQSRSEFRYFVERADAMEEYSEATPSVRGVLVVEGACPDDKAQHGKDLFRVIRDDPDLDVKWVFREGADLAECSSPKGP